MESLPTEQEGIPKIDVAAYFARLGLTQVDERPLLKGWREANAQWRRQRVEQIARHRARIHADLLRLEPRRVARGCADGRGRPREVWCVELRRCFPSLSAAAAFVGRKPSNISQSVKRGVRCGPYHWEAYEPGQSSPTIGQ